MKLVVYWIRFTRIIRNLILDLRFGTVLAVDWRRLIRKTDSDYPVLSGVYNTDSKALEHMFTGKIKEADVLIDVGCGRGRVINWWLAKGYKNRIVGIELDEEVGNKLKKRLKKYTNVEILIGDAIELIPPEATIIFMANPIDEEEIIRALKDRLETLFSERGNLTIYYYNPVHRAVFENSPKWDVDIQTVGGNTPAPFPKLGLISIKT